METTDFIAVGDVFEVVMYPDFVYFRVVKVDPPSDGDRWARCTSTRKSADGTWHPEGTDLEAVRVSRTNFMQSIRRFNKDEFEVLKILES